MQKNKLCTAGSDPRLFVNQPHAFFFEIEQRFFDVDHARYVLMPFLPGNLV
jgi:hypothetical protein